MKKTLILLVAALIALPALGYSDIFTFRVGYFFPSASSDLWTTEFDNLTMTRSDFQQTTFGVSYDLFLNQYLSLGLAVDTYSKVRSGVYKDYVGVMIDDDYFAFPADQGFIEDFMPIQTFKVSILPVQFSAKVTPLGRRGGFIPYFGGGVGVYVWNVQLMGDLIDFSNPLTYTDSLGTVTYYRDLYVNTEESNRFTLGLHALAGVRIPVGSRMTVEGEFKYSYIKGELKNFVDFEKFDLSGFQFSLGLNYWF